MSSKEKSSFDVAEFWLTYLNGPEGIVDNELNEMDEDSYPLDVDQTKTFKG